MSTKKLLPHFLLGLALAACNLADGVRETPPPGVRPVETPEAVLPLAEHYRPFHEGIVQRLGSFRSELATRALTNEEFATLRSELRVAVAPVYAYPENYWGEATLAIYDESAASAPLPVDEPLRLSDPRVYLVQSRNEDGTPAVWRADTRIVAQWADGRGPAFTLAPKLRDDDAALVVYDSLPENFAELPPSFRAAELDRVLTLNRWADTLRIDVTVPVGATANLPWRFVYDVRYLRPEFRGPAAAYERALAETDRALAKRRLNTFALDRLLRGLDDAYAALPR